VKAKPAAPMMVAEDFVRPELALKKMKSVELAPVFLNVLQTVQAKPAVLMMVVEEFVRPELALILVKSVKLGSVHTNVSQIVQPAVLPMVAEGDANLELVSFFIHVWKGPANWIGKIYY